jgi:hypothetical protein
MARTDDFDRPCFGVACPHRGTCRQYHAVDRARCDVTMQGTCLRNGQYHDYVAVCEVPRRRSMRLHPSAQLIEQCMAWASQDHARGGGQAQHRRA